VATEVELRFVHVDIPVLEERLRTVGATFLSSVTLREVRFSGLSGKRGEYIRARDDGRSVRLQHKAHDSEGYGAIERELLLDSGVTLDAAEEFLAGYGLRRTLRIERRRAQWALDPATIIVSIDQFPGIPPHVEVEAETLEEVHGTCARLGLDPKDHAGDGVIQIYAHYGVTLALGDIIFTPQELAAFPPARFGDG
jgi:adenylate cyclase, class 2